MFQFEKKVLDNGLKVITAPMGNTDAITLLVLVGAGSRYETKKINGVSHFLEHLFFKGTKSRPKASDVPMELNRIGADYNAFTATEITGFWVKSSAKDFALSMDIVSDILLEPLFKEQEIEKERGVILEEINMIEDDPPRKIGSVLENVIYGDQPVGWDVAGTKETVSSIKRNDIVKYELDNYLARNMVVAVAGNIDKGRIVKNLEKVFSKIKKGKNKPAKKAKIFQKSPNIRIISKDSDQTHFALAARGYDMFDERRYALNLLSVLLGGNASSYLFREIREKLGLAYYVYAWGDQYMDCGYLGMAAGIPHNKLETVMKKIIGIIGKVKQKGVSNEDLKHAKSFLRGKMALKFEASDIVASFAAEQELFYNHVLQPDDIMKKIEKVSQNDILKIAGDMFNPNKINMAAIGRQQDTKENQELYKKIFYKI